MSAASDVYAAVARWQRGDLTVDDVTALALQLADGDADAALTLMRGAVATWEAVKTSAAAPYRDRNGESIVRPPCEADAA